MGEFAALGTAVVWACSAILFTLGGNRVGADVVNLVRLYFGFVFIALFHWCSTGELINTSVENWRHGILFLSAFVGLVIGDGALFYAFVKIGTRLSMLIMSLVPVFSALFAWICFGEKLVVWEWLAISFSIAAIGYVVAERRSGADENKTVSKRNFLVGVTCALIGVLGQTGNLIITKYALVDEFSPLSATEWRIFYSFFILTLWSLARGKFVSTLKKLTDRKALVLIAAGAFLGPFVGIWLSYIAINHTRIAIASVIMATPPLLLIPLSAYFFKDQITARSVIGTCFAIAGISALVLVQEQSDPTENRKAQSTPRGHFELNNGR